MTVGTVRVRILVAVDQDGDWVVSGKSWWSDDDKRKNLRDGELETESTHYWIEADVPIRPTVIEGSVSDG